MLFSVSKIDSFNNQISAYGGLWRYSCGVDSLRL